jgi:hypothetical protein
MDKPTVFISYSHKDEKWKDRLHLACGEKEKARQSLAQAKDMIEDMGYHRRDGEVAELEEMLRP